MLEAKLDRNAPITIKYNLTQSPSSKWAYIQQVKVMSKSWKFIVFYVLLITVTCGLVTLTFAIPTLGASLSNFWGVYLLSQCWNYMMAGLGLAIPVCIIAFGLIWIQFYLMINGLIEPHLTSKGFGSALKTIYGTILK